MQYNTGVVLKTGQLGAGQRSTFRQLQELIVVLQIESSASIERFTQLLQAVPPAGAIVLSGFRDIFIGKPYRITGKPYRSIYLDHWRVADGHYNRRAIEARVEEPKACN